MGRVQPGTARGTVDRGDMVPKGLVVLEVHGHRRDAGVQEGYTDIAGHMGTGRRMSQGQRAGG